jgi:tRNA pseudouridine38-40 synthase
MGLRYHGWQVQKGVKTVQGVLERAVRYTLGENEFSLLGANRTDSGVSSLDGAFAIYTKDPLDTGSFVEKVNENLPLDVRVLPGVESPDNFNIIQDVVGKAYAYYFTYGKKPHPFFMGNLAYAGVHLDMDKVRKAAMLFEGRHDFRRFCTQGRNTDDFEREITSVQLAEKSPPWFPKTDFPIYALRFEGSGFLMHQIRRMVYALWMVGRDELDEMAISIALKDAQKTPLSPKAPSQGLVLERLVFKGGGL